MSIIDTIQSLADHHTAQANDYALDSMTTKCNAHKHAVIVFIKYGPKAYKDHCIAMNLTYCLSAANSNYQPSKKK